MMLMEIIMEKIEDLYIRWANFVAWKKKYNKRRNRWL